MESALEFTTRYADKYHTENEPKSVIIKGTSHEKNIRNRPICC